MGRGGWAQAPSVVVQGAGPFLPDTPEDICSGWGALVSILLSTCNARKEGNKSGPGPKPRGPPIFLEAGTGGRVSCGKGRAGLKAELLSGEEAG